jgi:hypothetical protein
VTKPMKGKPWCTLHKINTHSLESCWVLHPELRPSYLKEQAAQSARQAQVVSAKLGSSLSVKPKPALLSATKNSPPGVKQTMDSYYAEVVIDRRPYHEVEPFAVNVRAATTQRRSTETQRLRQVTQADMPLSYLPYPDATREQHPPNRSLHLPCNRTSWRATHRASFSQQEATIRAEVGIWLIKVCWTRLISIIIPTRSQTMKKCLIVLGTCLKEIQISRELWNL